MTCEFCGGTVDRVCVFPKLVYPNFALVCLSCRREPGTGAVLLPNGEWDKSGKTSTNKEYTESIPRRSHWVLNRDILLPKGLRIEPEDNTAAPLEAYLNSLPEEWFDKPEVVTHGG